jgi:hypothetical protein
MKRSLVAALLLACFGAAPGAWAQASTSSTSATHIYSCKDGSGRIITSDRPIPECSDRTMEERSKGGMLLREIQPALTPAQQRQKDAEEKQRREQAEEQQEQLRRYRVLLTSYSSEKDIEGARARALGDFKDALAAANDRLAQLYQERTGNQREAANYKGKTLPETVQRKIDLTDSAIASETQGIVDRKLDIDRINLRFDTELQRFRILTKDAAK